MGFGEIASSLILFISVLILTTGVVVALKQHFDETSNVINEEQKKVIDELKTDITIDLINYRSDDNETDVYVKNTGSTTLDINKIDIYVNNDRIPRNIVNRSIDILSDTEVKNIGYWDNSELIKITVKGYLEALETHVIDIVCENGVKDTYEFTV